jgi:hypothetical protein
MLPDGADGNDGYDMPCCAPAALGICVEFAADGGELGQVVRPRDGDGEGGDGEGDDGGREREERDDEQDRGVHLQPHHDVSAMGEKRGVWRH